LLEPTRIYVSAVRELLQAKKPLLTGLANITGGGFLENIPRILPKGLEAAIEVGSWPVPAVFEVLQSAGKVAREEMHRVFNMGIGMVAVTRAANADAVARAIRKSGVKVHMIGHVRAGNGGVVLL
jgi:phosphoribosylformylglycinamidine cyclo-ligase